MAGHNKWSKIKNTKGILDAKRGKLFTKLAKELTVAARIGGGNPDSNARLRQAIGAAKAASMPRENIERAIKKGTGELQSEVLEEILYEGYGPAGIAVLVEATTDNKNRTVSDLRTLFKSKGGNLGESGSVAWLFEQRGQLIFDSKQYPEEILTEAALEAGALDIQNHPPLISVYTEVFELDRVRNFFEQKKITTFESGFTYLPKTTLQIEDSETAKRILSLFEELEDHDDVQKLHTNVEIE